MLAVSTPVRLRLVSTSSRSSTSTGSVTLAASPNITVQPAQQAQQASAPVGEGEGAVQATTVPATGGNSRPRGRVPKADKPPTEPTRRSERVAALTAQHGQLDYTAMFR